MIGGLDVVIDGRTSPADLELLLYAARARWPRGVVESASGDQVQPLQTAASVAWPTELFIYESPEAHAQWSLHGLTDENSDRMIHVIIEAEQLTLVVDEEGSGTHSLAQEVARALLHRRLTPPMDRTAT